MCCKGLKTANETVENDIRLLSTTSGELKKHSKEIIELFQQKCWSILQLDYRVKK